MVGDCGVVGAGYLLDERGGMQVVVLWFPVGGMLVVELLPAGIVVVGVSGVVACMLRDAVRFLIVHLPFCTSEFALCGSIYTQN